MSDIVQQVSAPAAVAAETPTRPAPGWKSTIRRLGLAWLHLAVLWTFAVALPLFQLFDTGPDYLIAQKNAWPDIPLVSLGLIVVPPTVAVAAEALLSRWPRIARYLHQGLLGLLFAAFVVQLLKSELDPSRRSIFLVAFLAGLAFAYLYGRGRFIPSVLTVLSPVPLVVVVWFLGFSSVSSFAWPASGDATGPRAELKLPVVLVVFDEFSLASLADDGRVSRRFPSFRALAETSTWFRNATTVADNTTRAVPAIFTGRTPPRGELAIPSEHPPSLFDRVRGRFNVREPITNLCTEGCDDGSTVKRAAELTSSMVDLMKMRLRRGTAPVENIGLPMDALATRAEDLEAFNGGLGNGLNVLHIELPHSPYQYGPRGRYTTVLAAPDGLDGETWTTDARVVREQEARYLAQAEYTDRQLGTLMASVRRKGLWDQALVIVVADHGVAFVPGKSRRNVAVETFGEIAGVPMFVKAPGQLEGRISDAGVKTVDVLPTIADYLGADWALEGQSLREPRSRDITEVTGQFVPRVEMPLPFYEVLRDRASARLARTAANVPPAAVDGG